jgi:hypothetical protein
VHNYLVLSTIVSGALVAVEGEAGNNSCRRRVWEPEHE